LENCKNNKKGEADGRFTSFGGIKNILHKIGRLNQL